jgi:hypothetical protein
VSRRAARKAQPQPAAARPALKVSDHALFRFIERAGVVDVEQLRMALTVALDRAWQAANKLGQDEMLILAGGLVYLVRNGTVVTVMSEDGRHNQAASFRRLQRPNAAGEGGDVG